MKPLLLLRIIILCVFPFTSYSQNCSFDEHRAGWIGSDSARYQAKLLYEERIDNFRNEGYLVSPFEFPPQNQGASLSNGCRRTHFVVPIVFHVIYESGLPATNVSDSQITDQLQVLNDAFAGINGGYNTGIQFCLAKKKPDGTAFSGINRVADGSPEYRQYDPQKNHLASMAYYDRERYLNVWIVRNILKSDSTQANVAGYSNISYMGGVDGVVMRYDFAGNYQTCSGCPLQSIARGNALVHEIGHWLGLYHTFEGQCAGATASTCATQGDRCCDTRPHDPATSYCPTNDTLTCPSANTYYGNQSDPIHNYMSYTSEACKYEFTHDQATIMQANLMLVRSGISNIDNMLATDVSCCLTTAQFSTASSSFKCYPDTAFTFKAYPYSSVQHLWKVYQGATLVASFSGSSNLLTYPVPSIGKYDIAHALVYNGGSDTTAYFRLNESIELSNCGSNLNSDQANWIFGDHSGLRFTSMGVFRNMAVFTRYPNFNSSFDAGVTISNQNGDLLFYGQDVYWDKKYRRLDSSISVSGTPYQGIVSFPVPFKHHQYFIVSTDAPLGGGYGTKYAIFDTTVVKIKIDTTGGGHDTTIVSEGDIIVKNKYIKIPNVGTSQLILHGSDSSFLSSEHATAVPKCDGENYWYITIDGSGLVENLGQVSGCTTLLCKTGNYSNQLKLLSYSVDSSGFIFQSASDSSIDINDAYFTTLKASPDGQRLAVGRGIYKFDRQTGSMRFERMLAFESPYGTCMGGSFSPNSQLYYLTGFDNGNYVVMQYDLNSSTPTQSFNIPAVAGLAFIQIGPDNKLYLSRDGATKIPVINFPDSVCTTAIPNACGFVLNAIQLGNDNGTGPVSTFNLPNIVNAKKKSEVPLVIYHRDTACYTVQFGSSVCCASSFRWTFGDGDTSIEREPLHIYGTTGTYFVTLIADLDTIGVEIKIGIDAPVILGTDTVCDTVFIHNYMINNFNPYNSYTWTISNGYGTDNNYGQNSDIRWIGQGVMKVKTTNKRTGCIDSSQQTVVLLPLLTNNRIDSSQNLCDSGIPVQFTGSSPTGGLGSGTYSYAWYKNMDTLNELGWVLISGATGATYQSDSVYKTTYFKRTVFSSKCALNSNLLQILLPSEPDDSLWKDINDCDDVLGSTPTPFPAGQTVTFIWERSVDGATGWNTITGETSKELKYPVFFDTTYVRRVTSGSACISRNSNSIRVNPFYNLMGKDIDTTCIDGPYTSGASVICSGNKNIQYTWLYKTVGMFAFDTLPSYYTSRNQENISESLWYHECYLIRRGISAEDTSYSDTMRVVFDPFYNSIWSTTQVAPYQTEVCSGGTVWMRGEEPCDEGRWFYVWQHNSDTSNSAGWTDVTGIDQYDPNLELTGITSTIYYHRCAIRPVTGDTLISPAMAIRVRNPQVVTQPTNVSETEGGTAHFHTSVSDLTPLKWQQGKLVSGSMVWTDMTSGGFVMPNPFVPYEYTFDLYVLSEACLDGRKYRAVYQSPCDAPSTYTYSNEATLSVTPITFDLWSRDYIGDIGNEPTGAFVSFWNSPDIWNTKYQTYTDTIHQQPEYRTIDPSYIHAVVRNKSGQSTSPAAKLYLYWTFASTGEKWPRNWQFNPDLDSYNGNWKMFYGDKKGLGGLIGTYTIPPISSGGTWRIDTTWMVPHPGILVGDSSIGHKADICFLGRIVTCSEPQYGMYIAENIDLGSNVRYNNNIITKNFVVFDTLQGNQRKSWIGNGNPVDNSSAIGKLRLRPNNCNLFDYAYILIHLDATLISIWDNTNGSGYTVIDDSTLMVDLCNEVILENIEYDVDENSLIGIEVVLRDDYTVLSPTDVYYEFDVDELIGSDTLPVGGVRFGVPMHLEPLPDNGMSKPIAKPSQQGEGIVAFRVYPSPFADELKITYSIPKDDEVTITISNLIGQTISTLENRALKSTGTHKVSFNAHQLPEGIYFVTFTTGGKVQTKKVVLIR
ncbi:MAG: T9SS type A sorting domain-containing protein [Bacteroidia bacterium]|nr:T9SS type A sorting domain-containing protein [Bacteroidia bacterium]